MSRDMVADVKMEEGYMRMSIEYNNDVSKKKIQDVIGQVEKDMQVFPSVIRRAIDADAGNFSVEFDTEGMGRDAVEFCEAVLHKLNLKTCGA